MLSPKQRAGQEEQGSVIAVQWERPETPPEEKPGTFPALIIHPLLRQGGFVLAGSPREELSCDGAFRELATKSSHLEVAPHAVCSVTHWAPVAPKQRNPCMKLCDTRALVAPKQTCPSMHISGASHLHITPTLMGDASAGTNTKSMLVFWLIFGASPSTEEAQSHFFPPLIWGCSSREAGISATVTGAVGSYKA